MQVRLYILKTKNKLLTSVTRRFCSRINDHRRIGAVTHSSELEQRYDFRPRKDSQDTIRGLNKERTDIPWKTPITARGPEHKRFFLQIKQAKHNEVLQILQKAKFSGCLSVVLFDVGNKSFATLLV